MKFSPVSWLPMLLAGASSACGATAPAPLPAPAVASASAAAPESEVSCDGARGIECFERRRASCSTSHKSWRLAFTLTSAQHELYVSDLGLLRTDVHGARLFSHDGASWLGCLDECPPASGKRACIPYIAETSVSVDPPANCKIEQEPGVAWHGYPTRLTRWTCGDGRRLEVVAVPDLAAVRDALIETGFLKAGSSLATREGLPVVARVDHWPQFFEITAIEEMGCDSWDYPKGYAVYAEPERFDRLKEIADPLRSAVDLSLKRQTDELQRVVNERLIAEIGRRCLGERDSYVEAEVQQCVKDKPAIHPEVEALKRTAKDKLTQAVMERGQERARIELSAGLCNELTQ